MAARLGRKEMPKVAVVTPDKTHAVEAAPGYAGDVQTFAYLEGDKHPLHLHLHRIAPGERLRIGPLATDCVAYVWHGGVEAGGWPMAKGSSAVVEHGQTLEIAGGEGVSEVLTFTAAHPPQSPLAGGHVHLLPNERVPSFRDDGDYPVGGRMHADSACGTCEVWLHENHLAGGRELTPEEAARGIHSHTEDEVIFVIDGQMQLGRKLVGPGTAIAIAADTLYSFNVGPQGLSFVNFRPGRPSDIRFANGMTISETGYWQERVPRPEYVTPR
jgi:hypothetical protein